MGATTLCLPSSFLLRAERYFERNDAPLIKAYPTLKQTLYVREGGILCFGDPYAPPASIPTWREWYIDYCGEDPKGLADAMGMTDNDLDYEIDEWHFREMYWNRTNRLKQLPIMHYKQWTLVHSVTAMIPKL